MFVGGGGGGAFGFTSVVWKALAFWLRNGFYVIYYDIEKRINSITILHIESQPEFEYAPIGKKKFQTCT